MCVRVCVLQEESEHSSETDEPREWLHSLLLLVLHRLSLDRSMHAHRVRSLSPAFISRCLSLFPSPSLCSCSRLRDQWTLKAAADRLNPSLTLPFLSLSSLLFFLVQTLRHMQSHIHTQTQQSFCIPISAALPPSLTLLLLVPSLLLLLPNADRDCRCAVCVCM